MGFGLGLGYEPEPACRLEARAHGAQQLCGGDAHLVKGRVRVRVSPPGSHRGRAKD